MVKVRCEDCEGTGLRMPLCDADCPRCGGSGQREKAYEPDEPDFPDTEDGRLVRELCDEEGLSASAARFCNSVADQVLAGRPLTERQRDVVRQMIDEAEDRANAYYDSK